MIVYNVSEKDLIYLPVYYIYIPTLQLTLTLPRKKHFLVLRKK